MKGLLLIGGLATRLYPLSRTLPKSLLPICDRELLHYQVSQLARAGIREVILAAGPQAAQLEAFTRQYSGGLAFHLSVEDEPLGTAGAIANAAGFIGDEPLVVLNADILSALDVGALIAAHRRLGRAATVVAYAVDDPSRYGLLAVQGEELRGFSEKPQGSPGRGSHFVNAGVYVLEPQVLAAIPRGCAVSIERETFPQLIALHGALGCYELCGFWADVGTFESYFAASFALLAQRFALGETALWGARDDCAVFKDLVYIHKTARLGAGANLYHRVIVMAGAALGDGCELRNCILMPHALVGGGARLTDCIIGPDARVEAEAQVQHAVVVAGEAPLPFYPEASPPLASGPAAR